MTTQVVRGTVLAFNSATWTATIMLDGADVEAQMPVGEWVPAAMMVADKEVAVLVFATGGTDTDDGVVLGPYGAGAASAWSYPALAGLSIGQVLRATAAGAAAFGAVDLADPDAITGILPAANLTIAQGTWTPAFVGAGTAGVFTYTAQQGYYFQIGGMVFFWGRLTISAITTPPVGNMQITGLPVACAATYFSPVTFGYINNLNNAVNAIQLTAIIFPGSSVITLYESFDNAAAANVPGANFTNAACDLIFSGSYKY